MKSIVSSFQIISPIFPYRWMFTLGIAFLGVLGCTSTPPVMEKGDLIAVVDFQRVLEETIAGEQLKETFDSFMKDRQVLLELEQKEIQKIRNDLVNQGSVLSDSARQQREEQFQRRVRDYQVKEAALSRELQEKQQELMEDFRSDVKQVVSRIAQDRNLGLVVQHGKGTSTLYHREQFDISDEVIQEMNKE